MGSGGTFCPQKSFESTGSRRERAHPLDGCQESIACARSEHGSRRDGSRSGVALGFERATWARRRGRPVGRVRSAPSRRAGSIRPLAGAAARPAAAVVPAAASASASRANWLAFDERPSSQNPDYHLTAAPHFPRKRNSKRRPTEEQKKSSPDDGDKDSTEPWHSMQEAMGFTEVERPAWLPWNWPSSLLLGTRLATPFLARGGCAAAPL